MIIGTASAASHGSMEVTPALLCLLFAIFAQCTGNVMHRYFDAKKHLGENESDNIQTSDGRHRSLVFILREGIRVYGILTLMAGLAVMSVSGWWSLAVAGMIIAIIFISNGLDHPLSHSITYPIMTFLLFGPIGVIGTALVQSEQSPTQFLSWWNIGPALMAGVMTGLLAVNCHVIFGMFHRQDNEETARTTFYGRYGRPATLFFIAVNTLLFGAMGIWAPVGMEIAGGIWYLPVPLLSMALGFYTIYILRDPGNEQKAWNLSLLNIMMVAVLCLIVFICIGYPQGYHDEVPGVF